MDVSHDLCFEIRAAVAAYEPALFRAEDYPDVVAEMRRLVLVSSPESVGDAAGVLAALSRLVADTIEWGGVPRVEGLVTEYSVNRWVGWALANGLAPSTVSVHRSKFTRLLRVQHGLPARIAVRGVPREALELFDWQAAAEELRDPALVATLVAAVGCGQPAAQAVGSRLVVSERGVELLLSDGGRRFVVEALCPLAARAIDVEVGGSDWTRLRAVVEITAKQAWVTYSALACDERRSSKELVSRYSLTRKSIDRAVEMSGPPMLDDSYRVALR